LIRFGKHLLELGGNNALIVNEDADLEMVIRLECLHCKPSLKNGKVPKKSVIFEITGVIPIFL
jgi:hypothetical protein